MSEIKILVVVFAEDLPQFELMCYCLNKNWRDDKYIDIIYQEDEIKHTVENIVFQNFDSSWKITISQGINLPMIRGQDRQQIEKIVNSLDLRFKNVLVLDCKDFILKPLDSTFFYKDNIHQILYRQHTNETFNDHYPEVIEAIGLDPSINIRPIYNVTPWFWNVAQLQKLWDFTIYKYGPIESWTSFPLYSEFAAYYLYTLVNSNSEISFDYNLSFMPIGYQTPGSSIDQDIETMNNFIRFDFCRVWKHHRNTTNPVKTAITVSMLQKYDIPIDIIIRWVNKKYELFNNLRS